MVPILRDVQNMSFADVEKELNVLAAKVSPNIVLAAKVSPIIVLEIFLGGFGGDDW